MFLSKIPPLFFWTFRFDLVSQYFNFYMYILHFDSDNRLAVSSLTWCMVYFNYTSFFWCVDFLHASFLKTVLKYAHLFFGVVHALIVLFDFLLD